MKIPDLPQSCRILGTIAVALCVLAAPVRADQEVDLSTPAKVRASEGTVATATVNADGTGQLLKTEYADEQSWANFVFAVDPFEGPLTAISFKMTGQAAKMWISVRAIDKTSSVGCNVPAEAATGETVMVDFSKAKSVGGTGAEEIGYPITELHLAFNPRGVSGVDVEITELKLHSGN